MAYWLSVFNSLAIPTHLGDRGSMDIAAGAVAAPLISLPGGRVFDPLGDDTAYRPSAQITATVLLVSSTPATLLSDFQAWQAKVGTVGDLTRTDYLGNNQQLKARLLSASVTRNTSNINFVPMTLVFQVVTFPWEGTSNVLAPTHATVSGTPVATTITNNGNVTQRRRIQISFTPSFATMTSVTIQNTTTGHQFTYTGTVTPGNSVMIDTADRSVLNNGVADYAHFTPSGSFEDWFAVAPGANSVNYNATFAGTAIIPIIGFSDAWG